MSIKNNPDGTVTDVFTGLVYADQYSRVMGKPIPGRREEGGNLPNLKAWVQRAKERWKR